MQPNIFLFDFETTGLTPGFHDPIQVAALLVTPDLEEVNAFESLIRPANPQNATPEAMAIHKKPMSTLMAAPTQQEVMAKLKEGAALAGVPYVSGFNVDFDLRFLGALEESTGIRIARKPDPILCARQIYLNAKGLGRYTKGTKLTDLCAKYGVTVENAHDALGDVRMTLALLRVLRNEHPEAFAFLGAPAIEIPSVEAPAILEEAPSQAPGVSLEDQVAEFLTKIREADASVAAQREIVKATPEGHALAGFEATAEKLRAELRALLENSKGVVIETAAGKAGFQPRRSITYRPTDVRDLAGMAIAMLCIKETVDATALKAHIKAGVKAGTLAPDLLDQIEARAEVKTTQAFICEIKKPEPEADAAAPTFEQEALPF